MSQSLAQVYLHVVFSTKERQPFLSDPSLRDEMHRYLGGLCNRLACPVVRVGGIDDHVHLFCRFGRSIAISDLVKELKRESSIWIKSKSTALADFYWQKGYGAFSVSPDHVDAVREYVANQERHHNATTFQDEFRDLLRAYGLEWDEQFVWD